MVNRSVGLSKMTISQAKAKVLARTNGRRNSKPPQIAQMAAADRITGGLPPTISIVAFANPTSYQTVDLQTSRTVNSVQLGGTAAYTLTNGSLILSTGILTVTGTSGSPVTHVINAPVALGAPGTWSIDTSSLNVTGAISDGGNGLSLTKTGTGTLRMHFCSAETTSGSKWPLTFVTL